MKWCTQLLVVMLVVTVFTGRGIAGGDQRIGTSGAHELRIPIGARGPALGGSIVADVSGAEALYWNPAGVVGTEKSEVLFSYLNYLPDAGLNLSYLGISTNLRNNVALGVNVSVLSIGDIEITTENSPDGTGEIFSPNFASVGITYSQRLTDRVAFGASVRYIDERIVRETAKGVAFDFGFQYLPGFKGLQFGIVMRNFGPNMRFDGPDLEEEVKIPGTQFGRRTRIPSATFELPTSFDIGTSYDFLANGPHTATFVGSFRNNNFAEDEYQGGVEYKLQKILTLRGGYVYSPTATGKQYLFGPTFGAGVRLPVSGGEVAFDYSLGKADFFGNNQWFTVRFGF